MEWNEIEELEGILSTQKSQAELESELRSFIVKKKEENWKLLEDMEKSHEEHIAMHTEQMNKVKEEKRKTLNRALDALENRGG
jgi:hypothetical protein